MSAHSPAVESDSRVGHILVALLAPLAVVALAYALWRISDALLYIGPLDRAAFGWAIVAPLWLLAPVAAGFAWRQLQPRERLAVALTVGVLVTGAAGTLFWLAGAFPDCQYGATFTPTDFIGPSLLIGAVIGGSLLVGEVALEQKEPAWWGVGSSGGPVL